jgi:hypothetical protein
MDLKVHYRIRKIPPLDPILSWMNPVDTLIFSLFKINFNIVLPLVLRSPGWCLPYIYTK